MPVNATGYRQCGMYQPILISTTRMLQVPANDNRRLEAKLAGVGWMPRGEDGMHRAADIEYILSSKGPGWRIAFTPGKALHAAADIGHMQAMPEEFGLAAEVEQPVSGGGLCAHTT